MDLILSLGLSAHLGLSEEYNSIHPHIRLKRDMFISGAYYNSVDNLSVYSGIELESGGYGLEIAAVTGYEDSIIPMVRGTYEFTENTQFFIGPAPEKYDNKTKIRYGVVMGIEIFSK